LESYKNSINWFSNATPNSSLRPSQTSKQIAEFLKNTYEPALACHESCTLNA
jgi:hypothetical protein